MIGKDIDSCFPDEIPSKGEEDKIVYHYIPIKDMDKAGYRHANSACAQD